MFTARTGAGGGCVTTGAQSQKEFFQAIPSFSFSSRASVVDIFLRATRPRTKKGRGHSKLCPPPGGDRPLRR